MNKMILLSQEPAQIDRRKAEKDSRKYSLCPLAFCDCYGARDPEIIERVCSKAFEFCSSFQDNTPISKGEWESKSYVVDFITPAEERVILSGEN
jgi:hypothetical protein